MAVENKWADSALEAGNRSNAAVSPGGLTREFVVSFETAAADDNGSIFKLVRLPANAIMSDLKINCDAITGMTDVDLGLYDEDGVTAADVDCYMDGADIAAGQAIGSEENGLAAVDVADLGKKAWEIAGDTISNKQGSYVLALTANTMGSGVGTITVRGRYIEG